MSDQLKLNLQNSKLTIQDDSKKVPVGVRIGENFKCELERVAKNRHFKDLSELLVTYIIDGYSKDHKDILYAQENSHLTISELIARGLLSR
jgi:translation elongation factor EF-Ts